MEQSNKIIPPHLNAETYRTYSSDNSKPSYLDYLHLHADGSVLVGYSELTGRYWNGGVTVFKTVAEGLNAKINEKTSIDTTTGTADGCFLGSSNKVLICEDSGAVSVWKSYDDHQQNPWQKWTEEITVAEHDNSVLAVDCLNPDEHYVTVGADGNIKIWDVNEMICIRNYDEAHSLPIYGVSVKPQSTTIFATCSMDQYMNLWDDNVCKPVLDFVINDSGVRCLQWVDENRLVFGDEAGVLRLLDVRNTKDVFELTKFPTAVHKLAVHPKCDKVAVCCDNKIVSVCKIIEETKCNVIYHERHMHTDNVRGVAWDVKDECLLLSLGWNGAMKSHKVA